MGYAAHAGTLAVVRAKRGGALVKKKNKKKGAKITKHRKREKQTVVAGGGGGGRDLFRETLTASYQSKPSWCCRTRVQPTATVGLATTANQLRTVGRFVPACTCARHAEQRDVSNRCRGVVQ